MRALIIEYERQANEKNDRQARAQATYNSSSPPRLYSSESESANASIGTLLCGNDDKRVLRAAFGGRDDRENEDSERLY